MKKILSVILCILIILSPACAFADDVFEDTARIICSSGAPSFGYVGGEWAVTGLARSGAAGPDGYFDE